MPLSIEPLGISITKLESSGDILAATVWVYQRSHLGDDYISLKYNVTRGETAVQGNPRSLILVPIESAYVTSSKPWP